MVIELLVAPEVEAMVGLESKPEVAVDEVCRSEIRRYVIATMDDNPLWYDTAYAAKTKYGAGCAPGSYVLRAVGGWHRDMGTPDSVRDLGVDDDGRGVEREIRWPEGVTAFNGGDETEYFQLPKTGDIISRVTKLVKIVEKTGRSGRFVVLYTDNTFSNQKGEILAISRSSSVARRITGAAGKRD